MSICILSLFDRLDHLHNLLSLLYKQPAKYTSLIEILILSDNKVRAIGAKRNELLEMAKGEYIVFIDDDDDITEEYLDEIFKGINMGVDAIGIMGIYAPVVGTHKPFKCGNDYLWEEKPDAYYRPIQHICPIKTSIARMVPYHLVNYGEDKVFAEEVKHLIKSDYVSNIPIYLYKYVKKN